MASADGNRLLAADAYVGWRRLVKAARRSVRVYSPYFDRLVVDLLGNAHIDASAKSIVTDLSPASGTLDYCGQLLAIRRLLNEGIEIRTLPRLHSKALLVDGTTVTVGSQNVTSYAHSKETTVAPVDGAGRIRFLETLETWYADAEPVDLELIERLLDDLDEPFAKAKTAIEALVVAYEEAEAAYREEQRQAAISRLERDIARSRSTTLASRIRRTADATVYQAGQDVAYARLEWEPGAGKDRTLLRDSYDIDFTRWTFSIAGIEFDSVQLERLAFYPALLSPGGRLAFVRVAKQRITYVWRGLRRARRYVSAATSSM